MNLSHKMKVVYMVLLLGAVVAIVWVVYHVLSSPTPGTAEAYLAQADDMAFNNNWIGAAPVYRRAELGLRAKGDLQRALYAEVSQVPAVMESRPLPDLIAATEHLLKRPGAEEARTHLRILTVKGMLELEYDAGLAKTTWAEVERRAKELGEWRLASRASGEQGILAFLLGNVTEAASRVKKAYMIAKALRDRPAEVRYASLIEKGIVELGRYKESLSYP